ncbi:enolase C-terminal domain-like protein [Bradyrhizobium sp. TZ2]
MEIAPSLSEFDLAWLEEPIRADRPWQEWQALRKSTSVPPLAAGENIASRGGFNQALGDDVVRVVQPDIAKWGGLTEVAPLPAISKSGKMFCPHYLGGGIGLLASAHLLAGVGGGGLLEVDSNDNPLRDRFCGPVVDVRDGTITLSDDAGLGIEPELVAIEQYRTA